MWTFFNFSTADPSLASSHWLWPDLDAPSYCLFSDDLILIAYCVNINILFFMQIYIFSKKAGIMRRPQNLLDIKSHCLITNIMFLFLSIDQMKNGYLQYYHNQLGPKRVFQIWSNVFIIENLGQCNFQIIKQVMLKSCID